MAQTNEIWLFMGQSFMAGQGTAIGDVPDKYKSKYLHNLRVWQTDKFEVINSDLDNISYPTAANTRSCPVYWVTDYANIIGNDVYVLNYSQGAVGLALDGGATDFNTASVAEFYDGIIAEIALIKTWMDDRGKAYTFKGIVWWQGQEDALTGGKSGAYETNINNFFDGIVTATGNANLKIIQDLIEDASVATYAFKGNVNTAKTNFTNDDTANRSLYQPNWTEDRDGTHPTFNEYLRVLYADVLPEMLS